MNKFSRLIACSVLAAAPLLASAQGNAGAMNDERVQQMQQHMAEMQAMMQQMRNTTSDAERQRLREQHFQAMQEHMQMMHGGMMGQGMMGNGPGMNNNRQGMMGGGQGMNNNRQGMMGGGQGQGMMNNQGNRQPGNARNNRSGDTAMDDSQRLDRMEMRMDQMQLMMEQMLENQAQGWRNR